MTQPWRSWLGRWQENEFFRDLARIGAIFLVYRPIERVVLRGYSLPEVSYQGPLIATQALRRLWPLPIESPRDALWLVAWLLALGFLVARRKALFADWSQFGRETGLRTVVAVVAATVVWRLATYDFNLYFNQGHYVDRALLVGMGLLAWLRPIFLAPLAVQAVAVLGQFKHPLSGFSPSPEMLPILLLMIVTAALVVRAVGIRVAARHIVSVMMLLVAASYLGSGIGKLTLGWLTHGHVYSMFFAAYSSGWATFLSHDQVGAIGRVLATLDPLLMVGTLVIEVGVLALFFSRRTAVGLLVFGALFHVAVLSLSGIFFWMWIVVDLTLAWWLISRRGRLVFPDFSRRQFLASLILIPVTLVFFAPARLAWLDVPMSYSYRLEAIGESGRRYPLPPTFFAPYQYEFTLGHFDRWVRDDLLEVRWGAVTDRRLAAALLEVRTPADIVALEHERGEVRYNANRAAAGDRFVELWMTRYRARGGTRTWLSPIRAPRQLITFSDPESWTGDEPICTVEVYLTRSFFDGDRYLEIPFQESPIRSLPIESTSGCSAGLAETGTVSRRDRKAAGTPRPSPGS